ncbi:MAG: hypothetical protein QM630_01555 [Microbacterium sp.]
MGMVPCAYPQENDAQSAVVNLLVLAKQVDLGVERRRLAHAEDGAKARGRRILQTWTLPSP